MTYSIAAAGFTACVVAAQSGHAARAATVLQVFGGECHARNIGNMFVVPSGVNAALEAATGFDRFRF